RSMEDEVRTILRAAAVEAPHRSPAHGEEPELPATARAATRSVLLIIGGGIAAYKSLDLIRRLKERGLAVRTILTAAARELITPLSARPPARQRRPPHPFAPASTLAGRPLPAAPR